jgi:murein DD-endopeptidase MepM/ murein hydrolase activator NlpD
VMRTKLLKTAVLLLALMLVGIAPAGPLAPPAEAASSGGLQAQKSSIERRKNSVREKLRKLRNQETSLSSQMQDLDTRAADLQQSLNELTRDLKARQQELEALRTRLAELEAELQKRREMVANRVTTIYMQGELTYLDLLFNAENFREFINRMFYLNLIFEKDEELYNGVMETKQEVAASKLQVESTIAAIAADRDQLQQQSLEIKRVRDEKTALLRAVSQDKELAERQMRELEEQSRQIEAELRNLKGGYSGVWKGRFMKPVNGRITSPYGWRIHPLTTRRQFHTGIDIAAPYGTPIKAGGDGKVVSAGWRGGYGNTVIIDHGGRVATLYAHCSRFAVSAGTVVRQGQTIAYIGSTGTSTGNHVHFEVRVNGSPVDPFSRL